jgi:hypothetical protein
MDQFSEPETLTTEPGRSKLGRFQRLRVHPDFWINVYEEIDGVLRVQLTSYTKDVSVFDVGNYSKGSGAELRLTPKEGSGGYDERNGPPGLDD